MMYRIQTIILLLIVGLVVGVLFAFQLKSPSRIDNPVVSVASLQDAEAILDKDKTDLKDRIAQVKADISKKQGDLKSDDKASKELVKQVEDLRDAAGLTEVKDDGIVVTLADAQTGEATLDSIVHAADLRDLVNVLYLSGANAISINDQRLVLTTSIDSVVNTILINNVKIANPFVLKAVGDTKKMELALNNEQNLKDIKRRQKSSNLLFNAATSRDVTIPAFIGAFAFSNTKTSE